MRLEGSGRYHHGELREALLSAALDVLERDGPEALSLRALARKIGVSPMAPYHHFPDRAALLAAVAAKGFERLQARKLANQERHTSARAAIAAGAADYVRFILASPNLYRLMKGPELAGRKRYPELERAAAAPAATLLAMVSRLFAEEGASSVSDGDAATMLWGLAHGLGVLALDGQVDPDRATVLAADGANAMIAGWLAGST